MTLPSGNLINYTEQSIRIAFDSRKAKDTDSELNKSRRCGSNWKRDEMYKQMKCKFKLFFNGPRYDLFTDYISRLHKTTLLKSFLLCFRPFYVIMHELK